MGPGCPDRRRPGCYMGKKESRQGKPPAALCGLKKQNRDNCKQVVVPPGIFYYFGIEKAQSDNNGSGGDNANGTDFGYIFHFVNPHNLKIKVF